MVQRESKTPGPNAYFKAPAKLKGNSPLPKSDRINFLCDAEYLGKTAPGPTDYKPNVKLLNFFYLTLICFTIA